MDLNELLQAHQIAALHAGRAASDEDRQNQFDLIALYAKRIRLLRMKSGLPADEVPFVYGEVQNPASL